MIRNLLALTGLATFALLAAIMVQAYGHLDHGDGPRRVRVSYTGLDLSTPEGVRILEQRINAAVDDICGDDGDASPIPRSGERECRRDAIAGVAPQVDAAVERARERTAFVDRAFADGPPPPHHYRPGPPPPRDDEPVIFAPPQEVVQPIPTEYARRPMGRHVRRTTTTTTVTTTRRFAVAHARQTRTRTVPIPGYGRRPEVPGSWLPPSAWRQIERATLRSFQTGRLTRWYVPGREGYVTVSPVRWLNGRACRAVRVVKYAGSRQLVVADGTRCRTASGLTR